MRKDEFADLILAVAGDTASTADRTRMRSSAMVLERFGKFMVSAPSNRET